MKTTTTTYTTTEAFISGAICGHMWMPDALAGIPFRANLRGPWGILDRFSEPVTFAEAVSTLLMEKGGDFQNPAFSADTRITVIRRKVVSPGKYELHVWERELTAIANCAAFVNAEAYTGDFFDEN